MRQQMIPNCDLLIVGISEIYLRKDESLANCLPGYIWLCLNRQQMLILMLAVALEVWLYYLVQYTRGI